MKTIRMNTENHNFIVLDLEWNQCPYGKKISKGLEFEIIEIGAIKLDENMNIIDEFHAFIKPKLYKKLHFHVEKLVTVTMSELLAKGIGFPEAIRSFIDFCGKDSYLCTFGIDDIKRIKTNAQYYNIKEISQLIGDPMPYYDVQHIARLVTGSSKEHSLRALVEALNIEIKDELKFHSALGDATYTAKIMQKIDFRKYLSYLSFLVFNNSRFKETITYVIEKCHKRIFPSISVEYNSLEEIEKWKHSQYVCPICNAEYKVTTPWFLSESSVYYSQGICKCKGIIESIIVLKSAGKNTKKVVPVRTDRIISIEQAKQNLEYMLHLKEIRLKKMEESDSLKKKRRDKRDLENQIDEIRERAGSQLDDFHMGYLDRLQSESPTPGGGAVAALVGSIATALGSMVIALSVNKKTFAQYKDELENENKKLVKLREELLRDALEDEISFVPMGHAYRLPKDAENRAAAIQTALKKAVKPPCNTIKHLYKLTNILANLDGKTSKLLKSDIAVAINLTKAALNSAILNVRANTILMDDKVDAGLIEVKTFKNYKVALSKVNILEKKLMSELLGDLYE